MFVAGTAREQVRKKRQEQFYEQFVVTMMREAERLGITAEELADMIRRGENKR
ncbi:hypothetical protein D3C71_2151150 [compost metagenome]